MHKRNGRRKLAGNEKPVPDCVSDHRGDGDAKSDACRAGYRAVEKVGLTGEIRGRECHFRAEFRETVDEVNGGVGGCGSAPGRAQEECRRTDCHKESRNAVEVLLVFEEVGHCCFQNVNDIKSQHDDNEDIAGKETEASKQDDCSSDEQRGKFQRLEEHGLHRDQYKDTEHKVEGDIAVRLEFRRDDGNTENRRRKHKPFENGVESRRDLIVNRFGAGCKHFFESFDSRCFFFAVHNFAPECFLISNQSIPVKSVFVNEDFETKSQKRPKIGQK